MGCRHTCMLKVLESRRRAARRRPHGQHGQGVVKRALQRAQPPAETGSARVQGHGLLYS